MSATSSDSDLEQGIVGTAADADRVGDVLQLWPRVLMQDPRVEEAYATWRFRHRSELREAVIAMHALTAEWPPSAGLLEQPGVDLLMADMRLLSMLVANLGLTSPWLPKMLWFEFARAAIAPDSALNVTLPDGVVWPDAGRARKQGELHCEDLERNLTWLYRRTVKRPPDSFSALEKEHIEAKARMGVRISKARKTVNDSPRAAFLHCINHG